MYDKGYRDGFRDGFEAGRREKQWVQYESWWGPWSYYVTNTTNSSREEE